MQKIDAESLLPHAYTSFGFAFSLEVEKFEDTLTHRTITPNLFNLKVFPISAYRIPLPLQLNDFAAAVFIFVSFLSSVHSHTFFLFWY